MKLLKFFVVAAACAAAAGCVAVPYSAPGPYYSTAAPTYYYDGYYSPYYPAYGYGYYPAPLIYPSFSYWGGYGGRGRWGGGWGGHRGRWR